MVERRQRDVGDQALVARLHQAGGDPRGDRERRMVRAQDPLELGPGQRVGDRAQPVGPPQHVLHGVGERPGPSDHVIEQLGIAAEVHRGATRQVPRLVDQAPPQLPPFPEPVVRRVGAEHQQHPQRDAHQRVRRRRDRHVPDVTIERHDRDRPGQARQDPQRDLADQRALDVEQVIEPAVRIVLDHRGAGASERRIAGSEPAPADGPMGRAISGGAVPVGRSELTGVPAGIARPGPRTAAIGACERPAALRLRRPFVRSAGWRPRIIRERTPAGSCG